MLERRMHCEKTTAHPPEEIMRSQPLVFGPVGALLAAATIAAGSAEAENWPAWRGPTGDGVSTESNLPVEWDTERNIAWKLPLPAWSGSTPIVWGDRIFLNVAIDDEDIELWCLDRDTGQPIWTRHLSGGNRRLRKQNMSSPSPVTDGEHVWVMTGTGILKAFDVDGNELWTRDIPASYGPFGLNWGYASSPLLHDGALFVQVLHGMRTDDPSYVLRIDAPSGETVWRVERPSLAVRESPDAYSTPALLEYDGTTEIVITGGDAVTGHDPETGRELWRADGLNPTRQRDYRIVASPLVRDGVIYAPTRVRPLLALRPGGRGDVLDSHVIWSTDDGPDVPTPVTDGEYFYVVNDRGIVYVTDAKTGAPVYGPERIRRGTYSASPVLADGKIYVTNEGGMTTVLRDGPEFEVMAENDFDDYVLSSPAVSEGQVFIRTTGHLYAIGERREPPVPASNIAAGVAGTADESVAVLDAAGGREPAGEDGGAPPALGERGASGMGGILAAGAGAAAVLAVLALLRRRWSAQRG
ncbi:MAG: PQQ-binding-like beta-propeller repeat protein [Acidobacteria bacterium]|nr:PQQ-binding-like beta-propeller repeat protein [Acidobacteriota bacterium]